MHKDPIVEEVRKYRQQIAAKFGYDLRAIAEDARKRQATSGLPVVKPPKRRQDPRRKESAKIVVLMILAGGIVLGCHRDRSRSGQPTSRSVGTTQPATTQTVDQAVTIKSYKHGRAEAEVLTWRNESVVTITVDGKMVFREAFFSSDGEHGDAIMDGAWSPDGKYFAFKLENSGGHQPYRSPVKIVKLDGTASTMIDAEDVIRKSCGDARTRIVAVSHEERPFLKWISGAQIQVSVLIDNDKGCWDSATYVIDLATLKAKEQPGSTALATD